MTPAVTLLAWRGRAASCVPQLPACFRGGGDSGLVRKSARKRLIFTQNCPPARRQLPGGHRLRAGLAPGKGTGMDQPDRLNMLFANLVCAPARAARGLVHIYRRTLSPLIGFDCRHLPTCSSYADEALDRFGLWAGGWMTLARLGRCHPFGTSGLDFVPAALPHR